MKNIFIIGSGGFAKEVFSLINSIGGYSVKGFINHEPGEDLIIGSYCVSIIKESDFFDLGDLDADLAFGIGNPKILESLSEKYAGYNFPNLIHPSVNGNFDAIELGRGNIITANVTLTTCIKIGSFNIFNLLSTVGHDVVIGNYNVVNPSVNISGGVTIGNTNMIGVGSTILQYKSIGNNSIIGASSLVIKNVPDSVTVIGVPAKKMTDL